MAMKEISADYYAEDVVWQDWHVLSRWKSSKLGGEKQKKRCLLLDDVALWLSCCCRCCKSVFGMAADVSHP
jgi:hypothetical protein